MLGVDELEQEQAYLMERDRRHQRALHGYGTLCGLRLSIRDNPGRGPEVHLSRGMAVDRAGETICVPSDQCAALNGWLQKNQGHLALAASPPTRLVLDVRLCALECETDPVPIPGGPCRTQQDAIQPSRVKDNFKLELVPRDGFVTSPPTSPPLTSPPTTGRSESEATRALSDLLSHVELGDVGPYASLGDLLAWVRSIGGIAATSPPSAVPPVIVLPRATGFDMLRATLLVWVTEVRPRVMLDGCCARTPRGAEACVSLGYVELDVQADFT
ncbi:MAG: hypothetical protein KC621_29290, partial [Myxococcales bacterium]|nr:hypothetical protein [Myxococcales bacterium]